MAKQYCCWVLADGNRCGIPTRWTVKLDDDDQHYRKYDHFCHGHKVLAEKQDAEERAEEEAKKP